MNPENNPNNPSDASSEIENFPSFEEHIKSVQSAENEAEPLNYDYIFRHTPTADRPEGVRDAQDLKEYTEETEAKSRESLEKAKASILENYNVPDEKVEALTSSEEFAAFCRSGITIDELIKKNIIIARKEDYYSTQPGQKIYDYQRESSFADMSAMVKNLGEFYIMKENCDKMGMSEPAQFLPIKKYIDKLDDPSSLTKEDTVNLATAIYPNYGIAHRLLFGNPNNLNASDVISRTSMTLDHIREAKDGVNYGYYVDNDAMTEFIALANHVIEEGKFFPSGMSDYVYESDRVKQVLRPRLRSAVRAHMEDISAGLQEGLERDGRIGGWTEYDELKDLVLKSTDLGSICEHHDSLVKAGITEEELLGSVFGIDKYQDSRSNKELGEIYPEHYVARRAGNLIKAGFSEDSIINTIHDNEVYLTEEEIRDMRKANISDKDIAYASRICDSAYFYENQIPEGEDGIEVDGVKFSKDAILGAAIKEIQYRNHQNYLRSRQKNEE